MTEPTQKDIERAKDYLFHVASKHYIKSRHLDAGIVTCACGASGSTVDFHQHMIRENAMAAAAEIAAVRREADRQGRIDELERVAAASCSLNDAEVFDEWAKSVSERIKQLEEE